MPLRTSPARRPTVVGASGVCGCCASAAPVTERDRDLARLVAKELAQMLVQDDAAEEAGLASVASGVLPSKWCVTYRDLQQLRRIAWRAVQGGYMVPSDEDDFDPLDDRVGPSVETVTRELIKPVTAVCGAASWALMLHPSGTPECDLFITHAWREGVFEFVDKVLNSWPPGAKHAYCCMLSNPQNSDIGGLLDNPELSPFAYALRSCEAMLVVPNRTGSIYIRIWCVYEAFLATTLGKRIYTACAPVRGVLPRVVAVLLVYVTCLCFGWWVDKAGYIGPILSGVLFVLMLACFMLQYRLSYPPARNVAFGIFIFLNGTSTGMSSRWKITTVETQADQVFQVLLTVGFAAFFTSLELDWLRYQQYKHEAKQLSLGYTGKLQNARSSVEADREKILRRISEAHRVEDVERSIDVLINAGMSTPGLRFAASKGCDVCGAGWWNLSIVLLTVLIFTGNAVGAAVGGWDCPGDSLWRWAPWVSVAQGMAFVPIYFLLLRSDQRSFAGAAALWFGVIPSSGVHILLGALLAARAGETAAEALSDARVVCPFRICQASVFGPAFLTVAALNWEGCARVPFVGRFAMVFVSRLMQASRGTVCGMEIPGFNEQAACATSSGEEWTSDAEDPDNDDEVASLSPCSVAESAYPSRRDS